MKNIPLICVPITGETKEEIFTQLQKVIKEEPDVIEWRADFFKDLESEKTVIDILDLIGLATNIPLLFTVRSKREGGQEISLSDKELCDLLSVVASHHAIKYIDFEMESNLEHLKTVKESCHKYNKQLILSYHNFTETPDMEELLKRGKKAEKLGASIVKMAVMPNDKSDVHKLLQVTNQLSEELNVPIITMSMGDLGKISRLIGWVYGSVLTFAVGVEASAPGQIALKPLRNTIKSMQSLVE